MPREDKFKFYDLVIYAARSSSGARRLATSLGSRRWRDDMPERYTRRRPYFRGNNSPMVLNWGSTTHPKWLEDRRFQLSPRFINHAESVKKAVNKLSFFQHASGLNEVPLLKWTTDRTVALAWIAKGKPALCRTKLDGSSGQGIVLARTAEQLVEAPLYTRYYPKTHEFRVHVFDGNVIDLTQKKLRGAENADQGLRLIRSLDNGWVHAHGGIQLDEGGQKALASSCCSLVTGLGLTFGAVDVLAILAGEDLLAPRTLKAFVICEVNTGPGLENKVTIEAYKTAILGLKDELEKNNKAASVEAEERSNVGNLERVPGDQP